MIALENFKPGFDLGNVTLTVHKCTKLVSETSNYSHVPVSRVSGLYVLCTYKNCSYFYLFNRPNYFGTRADTTDILVIRENHIKPFSTDHLVNFET